MPRWITRNSDGDYVAGAGETAFPLADFGLVRDDVIRTINGKPADARMVGKLNRFLLRPIPGRTLAVTVRRGDEVLDLSITAPAARGDESP